MKLKNKMKYIELAIAAITVVLFFQNCGKGFSLHQSASSSMDALGSNDPNSGANGSPSNAPQAKYQSISSGHLHTCAVDSSSDVYCWGINIGQLGPDLTLFSLTPTKMAGLKAEKVYSGYNRSCVLTAQGGVKCWGKNGGALGNNSTVDSVIPQDVVGLSSHVVHLALGWGHACAVLDSGAVRCWGDNSYGELGVDPNILAISTVPVDIPAIVDAVQVTAGLGHSCFLLKGGAIKCLGNDVVGESGGSGQSVNPTPFTVNVAKVTAINASGLSTCALTSDQLVYCWGNIIDGRLLRTPALMADLSGIVMVRGYAMHTCALTVAGKIYCWGRNFEGQLGIGSVTTTAIAVPTEVKLPVEAVNIAPGYYRTCAVLKDDSVYCWGDSDGKATIVSTSDPIPTRVLGL